LQGTDPRDSRQKLYYMKNGHLPADRDGKVEQGEHLAAHVLHEHVRNDGGSDGGVGGLANTHHGPARHEGPEIRIAPFQMLQQKNKQLG
jgi:hypothetical protein